MTAGIRLVLRQVAEDEEELEQQLHLVAERHHADHEIHHVALDLARWSLQNRRSLAPLANRYGEELAHDAQPRRGPTVADKVREKTAELAGRRPETALLLLEDLRRLYLMAEGNSVLWTMLAQAAQTLGDTDLLTVVTASHGRTMRQAVWCNAMIKSLSPQALTAR